MEKKFDLEKFKNIVAGLSKDKKLVSNVCLAPNNVLLALGALELLFLWHTRRSKDFLTVWLRTEVSACTTWARILRTLIAKH